MAGSKKKKVSRGSARVVSCLSLQFEEEAAALGAFRCAGVDEVGRGPLAGPVVAAAVILPPEYLPEDLNDSKVLTAQQRERNFESIKKNAIAVGIGTVSVEQIDELNIYQASRLAMKMAVQAIAPPPDYLLIDGRASLDVTIRQRSIIKGDGLSPSVAAASVIAKVTRDRMMMDLHARYPQYGFDGHKGYATASHREALRRYGPSPVHRKSFSSVRELFPLPLFDR